MYITLRGILDRSLAKIIMAHSAEVITYDGVLFRQGQCCDRIYFVKWGEVTLTMFTGKKRIRLQAGQGALLGLPALIPNQPYTMTATASSDAEIFSLSAKMLLGLVDREPQMREIVLQILAGEVRAIRQASSASI